MGFTLYVLYGVVVLKGSDSELFCMCGTLERAYSMELIQGRLRTLMATVDYLDTRILLEDTIALIEVNQRRQRIVQEAHLSSTQFVQWDPQLCMPGPYLAECFFPTGA